MAASAPSGGRGSDNLEAPLNNGGRFIFNKKEKAKLAASFLRKGTDRNLQVRGDRVKVRLVGDHNLVREEDFPVVSTDRVISVIKSKSKKTAPGEGRVSYKVLGGLHLRAIERLRKFMEPSVRFGEVPLCWKTATVVLIPKDDKNSGCR